MSLHLLGAEHPRGILIRVRNTNALVAQQGGTGGAVAAAVADAMPDLAGRPLESLVLGKMADEFRKQLAGKGVVADVSIVAADQMQPAGGGGFRTGILAGLGLAGVGWAGWHFIFRRLL